MKKTYKVDLLPEDFVGTIFSSFTDCPLARAVKRRFNLDDVYVNFSLIWTNPRYWENHSLEIVNPEVEWNHNICERVKQAYDDPNHDTIYYVTLKEV